jgi:hypothetical protein
VEDILSDAVCESARRAERGVYQKARKQFRPEIPVFDLCMIVRFYSGRSFLSPIRGYATEPGEALG